MNKILNFKMQTISPLHISSGQEIEPYSYIVKADSNGDKSLYYINLYKFISLLSQDERQKLTQILSETNTNNSLNNAVEFVYNLFNKEKHSEVVLFEYKVTNKFYEEYKNRLGNKNIANIMLYTCIKDGNYKPYIPGSSIKGAVKRAFEYKHDASGYSSELLKMKVSERAEKDAFKMLKIADLYSNNMTLNIGYVKDFALNSLNIADMRINIMAEFIIDAVDFDLCLNINNNYNKAGIYKNELFEKDFESEKSVILFLNEYFKRPLEREIKYFSENGKNNSNEFIQNYKRLKDMYGENIAFINIGKFGGKLIKVNRENDKSIYARRYYTEIPEKNIKEYKLSQVMPIGWVAVYIP